MKSRLFLILLLSSMAFGQGAFIPPQQALKIVNGITSPVANATVTVCAASASGIPCTPALVGAIFKDSALTQPLSNPFTSDANGNYQFAIAAGTYTVTTTAFGFAGNSFQITVASASGGVATPGGSNTQVQFNNSGVLGGLGNVAAGSVLASQGVTSTPAFQTKPMVDVRDSAASFDCTGGAAMDTGMQSISSTAHILIPAGCIVRLLNAHTYPQTFEFKQGGQLKPDTGVLITLTGPIIAGSSQIFSNALPTQGGIDFTGNNNTFDVLPEWWGASTTASAATNTNALQAAIYGAFGCNTSPATTCRTNAANTSFYNKRLYLAGKYSISGELHLYHTLNFTVQGAGRLLSGIIQTATNSRIIDGQSNAFGVFRDISFSSTASQDLTHPLVDIDFSGAQGADLKPQFIDFYGVVWNGNNVTKVGVEISKSGGGAQGSNFNFYNNLAESFTEAAYMVGAGSGGTGSNFATNAVSFIWHGGDCQNNIAYSIEAFGLQAGKVDGTTFEDGGLPSFGGTPQTGYDILVAGSPAGAVFEIDNVRSESTFMASGTIPFIVRNSYTVDQAFIPNNRSGNVNLGDYIQGSAPGGHGVYYSVTATGTINFLGTTTTPRVASGGSATTLVDSVGGLTVNAWIGYQVSIVTGTGANTYCVITSNTATTFTCTGGFLTDFNTATIASPDNTSSYIVEPQWGSQFSSNGATWTNVTKTVFGSASLRADWVFIPGLQITLGGAGGNSVLHHLEVTRADWMGSTNFDAANSKHNFDAVIAGVPDAGPGAGGGNLGLATLQRSYKFPRNSLTEVAQTTQQWLGTKVFHWANAITGGGTSIGDAYLGLQGTVAGQGQVFLTNNSSGSARKWIFSFDASTTFPGAVNVSAGNIAFSGGKGQHLNTQAAANDTSGTCTAAAAATCTVTFTTAYTSAPSCTVTDQTNITTLKALPSTTTLVITTTAASSDVFSYICVGNPN